MVRLYEINHEELHSTLLSCILCLQHIKLPYSITSYNNCLICGVTDVLVWIRMKSHDLKLLTLAVFVHLVQIFSVVYRG